MRIIRASELSSYKFCRRSWWYQQEGREPSECSQLAAGRDHHDLHTKQVMFAIHLRRAAYIVLLSAIVLILFNYIGSWG